MSTDETRRAAERWFDALHSGDRAAIGAMLTPDIEWINYIRVPGYNDAIPWIGEYHSVEEVLHTFDIFLGLVDVQHEDVLRIAADGDQAACMVHEQSVVKATGMAFDIQFVQWLTIRDGRVARWQSFTDPSAIIRALKGG